MTVEQLAAEALSLPSTEQADLMDMLLTGQTQRPDPEIERAWAKEARRRLEELRSGKAKLIPGDQVAAQVRKLLKR